MTRCAVCMNIQQRKPGVQGFPNILLCKQNCFVKIFDKVNILLNQHPETSLQSWLLCSLLLDLEFWYSIKWTFHWVRAAPFSCYYSCMLTWQIYWIESLRGSFVQRSRQPKGGMGDPYLASEEDCICLFSLLRALRTGRKKQPLSCKISIPFFNMMKITKHWIDTLSFSFKNQMKTKTLEWVIRLVLCFSLCPVVLGRWVDSIHLNEAEDLNVYYQVAGKPKHCFQGKDLMAEIKWWDCKAMTGC